MCECASLRRKGIVVKGGHTEVEKTSSVRHPFVIPPLPSLPHSPTLVGPRNTLTGPCVGGRLRKDKRLIDPAICGEVSSLNCAWCAVLRGSSDERSAHRTYSRRRACVRLVVSHDLPCRRKNLVSRCSRHVDVTKVRTFFLSVQVDCPAFHLTDVAQLLPQTTNTDHGSQGLNRWMGIYCDGAWSVQWLNKARRIYAAMLRQENNHTKRYSKYHVNTQIVHGTTASSLLTGGPAKGKANIKMDKKLCFALRLCIWPLEAALLPAPIFDDIGDIALILCADVFPISSVVSR